ncbi:MAG: phosphodiester glycosidase family protein [Actinomycetota bacterium]|nr:phosphodiester glycosidase family protein [Actinomycetota bacterium]
MFEFDDRVTVSPRGRVTQRSRSARSRSARSATRPRAGRVIRLTATLSLFLVFVSFVSSVFLAPSSISVPIRAVEWVKNNGANGFVLSVENFYYTLTAPSKGGKALKALPKQSGRTLAAGKRGSRTGRGSGVSAAAAAAYQPPPIKPLIKPALPGEGQWLAPFKEPGLKYPPVLITSYRSDPAYPQMVAGVAWINTGAVDINYYPGIQEPSVNLPSRGPEMVPTNLRYKLLATFNSGFKLVDSGGGVVVNRHTYAPLKRGDATFVKYTNGKVNVIAWHSGPVAGPNVLYARQNLPLIVNNGQPNPNLSNGPQWGATLGNAVQVWRSAVGIDKHGDIIYAAANYQTVGSLAQIMIHAGAVRAMEMDINYEWPSFITYTGPGAVGAANLLPGMAQSPERYLTPDIRDFYAVYLKPSDLATRRRATRATG